MPDFNNVISDLSQTLRINLCEKSFSVIAYTLELIYKSQVQINAPNLNVNFI